jgi:hypothetical protein
MEITVELYNELDSNIELTVALPVYNSKNIAWLCLEGLVNQINIDFDWELIVYEEMHDESVFPKVLEKYHNQLKNLRCRKILFITNVNKVNLIDKWITIGKNMSNTSEVFMLQAADCYSPKTRLKTSYDKIKKENFDWYDQTKGYFYSFISKKLYLYDIVSVTNLNMSLNPRFIKSLPYSSINKGIDGYIYSHCLKECTKENKKIKRFYDNSLYPDSVDTHGYNNISVDRENIFKTNKQIFKDTNLNITQLDIPFEVSNKIDNTIFNKNSSIKATYNLSILISTYENVEYLKQCFDSIDKSIGNLNVEVLIGIDSCLKTREYVMKNQFPSNFRFYFFEKNIGPYTVFNTLSNLSSSENIMFFGSDDIMGEDMVKDMIDGLKFTECVRSSYINFRNISEINQNKTKVFEGGVFAIKKEIFNSLNGFEPWMCEGDSEFILRLTKNRYKIKISNKIDFYRRIHNNGLTSRVDTGLNSKLRNTYRQIYINKSSYGPLPKKITENFTVLNEGSYNVKKNLAEETKQKSINPLGGLFSRPQVEETKTIDYGKVNDTQKNRNVQRPERITETTPENKNSNAGMAKNATISKKPVKPIGNSPLTKIGKDFLRI